MQSPTPHSRLVVDVGTPEEPRSEPSLADTLVRRVVVDRVRPSVDGGRFAVKRTVGEPIVVGATILVDGHDVISAVVQWRRTPTLVISVPEIVSVGEAQAVDGDAWHEAPMTSSAPGTDEWTARFALDAVGWHEYSVSAWIDAFLTWRRDLQIKSGAGQDVATELLEGALLLREAGARAERRPSARARADADCLLARADALNDAATMDARVAVGLSPALAATMARYPDRSRATISAPVPVWVDRERARFGAWYEMFPRSAGDDATRSGTFADAAAALPRIADFGFDVVYLPPVHPIGSRYRKGRNNALVAGPDDPGSPWAIGSPEGGHTEIDPALGTVEDFVAFRAEAERLGLEVALDLAWQCSPDHPWVTEHPEWFRHRPDGTIKYAENPPKRYQDIYPFDFECEDWRNLWRALRDVVLTWADRGVRAFRVDNPHTKTLHFWEWWIAEVHARHPDVIFLAEAFTRPALMQYLAKAGFTQSYTYFTWRNSKAELTAYFTELARSGVREYLRPNLFANTPDILHAYLQGGGRPAFEARLILAATLGASYGIYSGFELCENLAVPDTEEYLDSEKYQVRRRDWRAPGIQELVARVNHIRRRQPALQWDTTLRFHETDNDAIVAYSKSAPDADGDDVLVVVNVDPHHLQHGWVDAGVDADRFAVRDLLDDAAYEWRRGWNYVRLEPGIRQGHILCLSTRRT